MAFISCVALPEPPAPEWLFNYENVVFNGTETLISTDIDYDVATFGNKAWKFQFKVTQTASSVSSVVALMGAGAGQYYGGTWYGDWLCFDAGGTLTYISDISDKLGKDISIEYDGNGTLKTYIDDALNTTVTNFDPCYLNGIPSADSKILLGAWYGQGYYFNSWDGTFEYIRMKILD